MQRHLEQRYSVKLCVKLRKIAIETFCIIQETYEEEAVSRTMVFVRRKRFENGCEDVKDDNRVERHSTSRTVENVVLLRELLNTDRRLSV